jgi:hypothetical protein
MRFCQVLRGIKYLTRPRLSSDRPAQRAPRESSTVGAGTPTSKVHLARKPASLPKSDGAGVKGAVCFWTHSAFATMQPNDRWS